MKKAQASMEFLMLVIVMLFFVLLLYAANLNKINEISITAKQQEVKTACESIASAINGVYYFGNGFMRNVTVSGNHTIRMFNKTIICYDGNQQYIGSIVPSDVRNSTDYNEFEIKTALKNVLQIENKGYIVVK